MMKTILNQVQNQQPSVEEVRERLSRQMRDRNRVGLGWLRFSCSVKYLSYWRKRVGKFFRVRLKSRGKGWQGYLESYESGLGIIIAYTPVLTQAEREAMGIKSSPNEGMMTVDIPQSALDSLSDRNHWGLWIDIFGCDGVKFTRVDVYYDDYCKIISPEALHKACKGGGVAVPRYEKLRGWDEYNLREGKQRGFTVYVGSEKSDRQIRYYDKFLESDGKQDCYRLEMEDKGQYAEKFGSYMLEVFGRAMECRTVAQSVAVLRDGYKALIKGAISFHEVPVGVAQKDLPQNWANRSPQTWWWVEMMAGLEPAKLTLDRVEPSLQKLSSWLKSQVMPGLALMMTALDYWGMHAREWLAREIDEGSARWRDKHWKQLEEAQLTSPAY